jgi:tetratricopeptide (TPR) repeat protein
MTSCGASRQSDAALARADSLLAVSPAAALDIADSLLADSQRLDRRRLMRCRLLRLQAFNKLDTVFTRRHVGEAQALAAWFDRHGSSNEQLRAHYILGRTYADAGEAPMALEAYNDAVERADTLAEACDYSTLCRVYSQMAVLFYQQDLLKDNLICLDKSIAYAYKANDIVAAVNSYGQKADSYERLNQQDSVIVTCLKTVRIPEIHIDYMAMISSAYIKKGEYENARKCLETYEKLSGYFDHLGNIEKGREAYYHIKGSYFWTTGQLDSAEAYFRKELQQGTDFNNQNMAARSLSLLFQRQGKTDSTAKYGLYSYQMVDSVYKQMSTKGVARMQAMHDYSRHQQMAYYEKERATREYRKVCILIGCVIFSFIAGAYVFYRMKLSKRKAYNAYKAKIIELDQVQSDLLKYRSTEKELRRLISEKESKMIKLNAELATLRSCQRSSEEDIEKRLLKSPVYLALHKKANQGELLTEADWTNINQLFIEQLPALHQFVMSEQYKLGINEYRAILLLRLHVKPKPISNLLGCSPQNVTKISKAVLSKLFNTNGTCVDLSNLLVKIV